MAHRHTTVFAVACLLALLVRPAIGQSGDDIVQIEEDWELVLSDPDAKVAGPQVTCVISPVGNADSLHAIFNINHQTLGGFVAGGMQLQIWHCETPIADRKHPNTALLSEPGEVVRWTQEMSVDQGNLQFAIKNGSSSTWGNFGGQGYLTASVAANLPNLNNYSPAVSIQNSGVAFAANRVQTLQLKRVRVYRQSGEVTTVELNKNVN